MGNQNVNQFLNLKQQEMTEKTLLESTSQITTTYPVGQKNCTLFIFSTARVKPHSMSILFGIQIPE